MARVFKIIFSVWILFHLSVMVIMSNGASFFARNMGSVYRVYANQLNMNTNWNFFSPDPASVMYIKYIVYYLDDLGQDVKESVEGYYPKEKNRGSFGLTHRRHFYLSRYLLLSEERMEGMYAPWLCKQYPGSTNIMLQTVGEQIPTFEEITGNTLDTELKTQTMPYFKKEYQCPKP